MTSLGRLLRHIALGTLTAILAATSAGAEAGRPVGVVELFTSQGCSSCPPADALFGDFATADDIVALAYHVDYWDYLGWKDTLGSHRNTRRQRAYAGSLDGSVYTPQVVVNGRRDVIGSHGVTIRGALKKMAGTADGLTVDVDVTETDTSIMISVGDAAGGATEAEVVLARFIPRQRVQVTRGENRGRTIDYRNSVTGLQIVGMWHGKAARYELPRDVIASEEGCAVLLQVFDEQGNPGAILGAGILDPHGGQPR